MQKLNKVKTELINAYQKEQEGYIQSQINKIRNLVEDRQSWIAWQTVNEVSNKKEHLKSKTKSCQPRRTNIDVKKKILRISLETSLKSQINLLQKSLIAN